MLQSGTKVYHKRCHETKAAIELRGSYMQLIVINCQKLHPLLSTCYKNPQLTICAEQPSCSIGTIIHQLPTDKDSFRLMHMLAQVMK